MDFVRYDKNTSTKEKNFKMLILQAWFKFQNRISKSQKYSLSCFKLKYVQSKNYLLEFVEPSKMYYFLFEVVE